jgi:hypothetical protein
MPGSKLSAVHVDRISRDRYATYPGHHHLELADRGVGLKMRNTEGWISWSRALLKSI